MNVATRVLACAILSPLATCSGGSDSGSGSSPPPSSPPPSPPPSGTYVGATTPVFAGLLDAALADMGEQARDVAFTPDGGFVVVGGTSGADFPTTPGAYDRTFASGGSELGALGPTDVFVTKISASGQIVWSTFLGGPNYDRAYAVEVDAAGAVYVGGRAGRGFPTTPGVVQPDFAGDNQPNPAYGAQDGFVAKLSPDGSSLLWSTYVGGIGPGFLRDIDIDSDGRVYASGPGYVSAAPQLVTANAYQGSVRGAWDALYVRLAADGRSSEYGTFIGGMAGEAPVSTGQVTSIRVTPSRGAVIVRTETATDVAATPGAVQPANAGGADLLIVGFTASDSLDFATYLGGAGTEEVETHFLAIAPNGDIFVSCRTDSTDYPTTPGVLQSTLRGGFDSAISALSSDGGSLVASTYLGGSGSGDQIEGVGVAYGPSGTPRELVVSGGSNSSDLPVSLDAYQRALGGQADQYFARLALSLCCVNYLTYFGGSGAEAARASAVAPDGRVAMVGQTDSSSFPSTPGAPDRTVDGPLAATYALFGPGP